MAAKAKKKTKKNKKGAGRPVIPDPFTQKKNINKLMRCAQNGMTTQQIAALFGMSQATLFNKMDANPKIREYIDEGKSRGLAIVTSALMKNVKDGSTHAQMFYLRAKGGWRDKTELVHTTNVQDIEVEVLKKIEAMSPEQRASRLLELEAMREIEGEVIDVEVLSETSA